jgi:hypothetical protein
MSAVKLRAATTDIVLDVLRASPGTWLTMRQILDAASECRSIKLGAIASALVNLEISRHVEVTRGRRPLLYRASEGVQA